MNTFSDDPRIVMTLDAGGTNFVFSAMQGCREITGSVHLPAVTDDLDRCLDTITQGFATIKSRLPYAPVAISFAFPGPADYRNGVIGDLPNFPAFRGGIALGPYLSRRFGIPVFINNDGNLFAYGEAMAGALPRINRRLQEAGSGRRYRNLIGLTLGTGFGAGVVIDGRLLRGDNDCGGDVWCLRDRFDADMIVEESVSIRAITRHYALTSGDDRRLTPRHIFMIAEGTMRGHRQAAEASFARMGRAAADAIASMLTVIDGIVVIGGGIAAARKYFMPELLLELNSHLAAAGGQRFPRVQSKVYDLDDPSQFDSFARDASCQVPIPGSGEYTVYDHSKRTGVLTVGHTSRSVAIGAYIYALTHLL